MIDPGSRGIPSYVQLVAIGISHIVLATASVDEALTDAILLDRVSACPHAFPQEY